jgi:hypothetical protein
MPARERFAAARGGIRRHRSQDASARSCCARRSARSGADQILPENNRPALANCATDHQASGITVITGAHEGRSLSAEWRMGATKIMVIRHAEKPGSYNGAQ